MIKLKYLWFLFIIYPHLSYSEPLQENIAIEVGTGYQTSQGIINSALRYFYTENIDFALGHELNSVGQKISIGTRYYTGVWSETCYFFIPCESRIYGSLRFGMTNKSTLSEDNDEEEDTTSNQNRISINEGSFYSLSIGFFDLFREKYVISADINYQLFVAEPSSQIREGNRSKALRGIVQNYFESGLGVGINLGYIF